MLTLIATAVLGVSPLCAEPSHDRLLVQTGRDVCAPALDREGRPRATGFLPTACRQSGEVYVVDADGRRDVCRASRKAERKENAA